MMHWEHRKGRVIEARAAGKSRPAAQWQRHKALLYNLLEKVEVRGLRWGSWTEENHNPGKDQKAPKYGKGRAAAAGTERRDSPVCSLGGGGFCNYSRRPRRAPPALGSPQPPVSPECFLRELPLPVKKRGAWRPPSGPQRGSPSARSAGRKRGADERLRGKRRSGRVRAGVRETGAPQTPGVVSGEQGAGTPPAEASGESGGGLRSRTSGRRGVPSPALTGEP